jgi:hypothetical protein
MKLPIAGLAHETLARTCARMQLSKDACADVLLRLKHLKKRSRATDLQICSTDREAFSLLVDGGRNSEKKGTLIPLPNNCF